MSTIVTTFTGDIGDLQDKINKAQGSINDLGETAKKSSTHTKSAGDSAKEFGDKAGKAGQSSAKMAGALGLISPAAANAARNLSDLADIGEVAADAGKALGLSMSTMGPIAVGLAATIAILGAAYSVYETKAKRAKEATDAITDTLSEEAKWNKKATDAIYDLADGTGTLSVERKKILSDQRIDNELAKTTIELNKRILKLKYEGRLDEAKIVEDSLKHDQEAAEVTKEKTRQLIVYRDEQEKSNKVLEDRAKAEASNTKALAEREAAEKALEDVQRQSREASKKREEERAEASERINDILKEATDLNLSEIEKLRGAEKEAVQEYLDLAKIKGSSLEEQAQMEDQIVENHERHITEVLKEENAKRLEDEKQAREESAKLAKEHLEEVANRSVGLAKSSADLTNAIIDATSKNYDTSTEAGKKAAKKQFAVQKAAAIATAVINGALGVTQALASGPPPYSYINAGISGALAAVELGVIAGSQPTFHMGSSRVDEMNAKLQKGEGVVTSQGMAKPGMKDAVEMANAGFSPFSTSNKSQPIQYRHKVFNEFIRDNINAGSPVTNRIDQNTKVGHRARRN